MVLHWTRAVGSCAGWTRRPASLGWTASALPHWASPDSPDRHRVPGGSPDLPSLLEVAGHVEDDLGRGPEGRGDVGGGQGAPGTEGHRHPVGPVVTDGEVEGRAGRVVRRAGAEEEADSYTHLT